MKISADKILYDFTRFSGRSFKMWKLKQGVKILILIRILPDSCKILQDLNNISTQVGAVPHDTHTQIPTHPLMAACKRVFFESVIFYRSTATCDSYFFLISYLTFLIDQPKKTVEVGLVFTMTFKPVYSDLDNTETKELIAKIEEAVSSTNLACFS